MTDSIINYGDKIPKLYKTSTFGENKKLRIQNLFRGIIFLAPSFAGKTNLVFHIIANSPNIYSHLHLIARNPNQELYNFLREKLKTAITIYDPDKPPSVDQIEKETEPQLVVIDDYSNDKNLQKNLFSHYFTRGRHKNLSTLFLSHSYFATDKMIRLNSEYVFILKANSKRDLQMVLKDFNIPNLTEKKLIDAYNEATKSKGQMLMIDNVRGEIRQNFNKIIKL